MLSRQGGLNLEIKCPCARKMWHEREVGIFLKWAYFSRDYGNIICFGHLYLSYVNNNIIIIIYMHLGNS